MSRLLMPIADAATLEHLTMTLPFVAHQAEFLSIFQLLDFSLSVTA